MKLLVPLILGTSFLTFQPISAGLQPRKFIGNKWKKNTPDPQFVDKKTQKYVEKQFGHKLKNQGDVVMTESQYNKRTKKNRGPSSRTFVAKRIWDRYPADGRYRIALKIDVNSFQSDELEHMKTDLPEAVKDFREKTGIWFDLHCDDNSRFYDLGNVFNNNRGNKEWCHEHYMTLTARSNKGLAGCSSYLGRVGTDWQGNGEQQISLQRGCAYKNTISHEIIHALGWTHEQNRADRDDVIYVDFGNIAPSMVRNFKKETKADNSGSPYDLDSIMQYHEQAFTTDWSKYTMQSRDPKKHVITSEESFDRNGPFQKRGLSVWDAYEINYQYSLKDYCEAEGQKWELWSSKTGTPIKWSEGGKIGSDSSGIRHNTCQRKTANLDICKTCRRDQVCVETEKRPFNECISRPDPCDANPCENGGKCTSDMSDSTINPAPHTCACRDQFFGENCESKVLCTGQTPMVFDNAQTITKFCPAFKWKNQEFKHSGDMSIWHLGSRIFLAQKFRPAKTVEISDGVLETIKSDTFSDLPNLLNLQLRKNKLIEIPDNVFKKNNKLKILNLSYNKLESFPRSAVKNTMKKLYLNNNEDLEVKESTFDNLNNAGVLHLQDIGNSPNELSKICKSLKKNGKIKKNGKCCYYTKIGSFGRKVPVCI